MSSLAFKLRTLRNTLEVFGAAITVRAVLAEMISPRIDNDRFDRRFGTDTTTHLSPLASEIPAALRDDAESYEPAAASIVHHAMRRLPVRHEDFVFVDAGCGKGRALLIASMYPFAKIVGIEISEITSRIARRNVAKFVERTGTRFRAERIEIVCGNVLEYRLPDANLCIFLFNPFHGAVFEAFMDGVHDFSRQHPARSVVVVYCNPWSGEEWLQRSGRFRKVLEHRVIPHNRSWNIWAPVADDNAVAARESRPPRVAIVSATGTLEQRAR